MTTESATHYMVACTSYGKDGHVCPRSRTGIEVWLRVARAFEKAGTRPSTSRDEATGGTTDHDRPPDPLTKGARSANLTVEHPMRVEVMNEAGWMHVEGASVSDMGGGAFLVRLPTTQFVPLNAVHGPPVRLDGVESLSVQPSGSELSAITFIVTLARRRQ